MLNHIILMGRMVRDPELRHTQSGVAACSFTIAVDRDFSGKGEEKIADFFDCTAWRGTAEFVANYFGKGRMIVVDGSLQNEKWTDKDGNNRISAKIMANNVYFADSKRNDSGQQTQTAASFSEVQEEDGALPF